MNISFQKIRKRWLLLSAVLSVVLPGYGITVDGVEYQYYGLGDWESTRQANIGEDGKNVYYHIKNWKIDMPAGDGAAIEVKGNVIIAVEGFLHVKGGDAYGFKPGGAGIHVPQGSTLRIMAWEDGPCTVTAYGGNAAAPDVNMTGIPDDWRYDNGGGGAGAGIGGNGGRGGVAKNVRGSDGTIIYSNHGEASAPSGKIIIDKGVTLTAIGGKGAGVTRNTPLGIQTDWSLVEQANAPITETSVAAGAKTNSTGVTLYTTLAYITGNTWSGPYGAYGTPGGQGGGGGGYPAAGIGGGGSGGGAGGFGSYPAWQTGDYLKAIGDGGNGGGGGTGYGYAGQFGKAGGYAEFGYLETEGTKDGLLDRNYGEGYHKVVKEGSHKCYTGRTGHWGQKNFSGRGRDYGETDTKVLSTVRPGSFLDGGSGGEPVDGSDVKTPGFLGGGVYFDSQSDQIIIRGNVTSKANGGEQLVGYDPNPGLHVSYTYPNQPYYINDIGHALPGEANPFTVVVEDGGKLVMNRKDYIKIVSSSDPSAKSFVIKVKNYTNETSYYTTDRMVNVKGVTHYREEIGATALYISASGWNEEHISYYQTPYNQPDYIHTATISMAERYYSNEDLPSLDWEYTGSGAWGIRAQNDKTDYGFKGRVDTRTTEDKMGILLFDANIKGGTLTLCGDNFGATNGWQQKAIFMSSNAITGMFKRNATDGRADLRAVSWAPLNMWFIGTGSMEFDWTSTPVDGKPQMTNNNTDGSAILGFYSESPTLEGGYLTVHGEELETVEKFVRAGHREIFTVTWNPRVDMIAPASRDKVTAQFAGATGAYQPGMGGMDRAMASIPSGKSVSCTVKPDNNKSIFFTFRGNISVQIDNGATTAFTSNDWTTRSISVSAGTHTVKFTSKANGTLLYDISEEYPLSMNDDGSYLIMNADQLMAFAEQFNNRSIPENVTVKLGADIDLNGHNWVPIAYYTSYTGPQSGAVFKGTFDGCGHKIKNMKVSGDYYFGGFFGVVENATIRNFGIESGSVIISHNTFTNYMGYHAAGGIAGRATGNTLFECVYNCADVTNHEDIDNFYNFAGGITGYIEGAVTYRNVYNQGKVSALGKNNWMQYVGGISGVNSDDMKAYWCYNTGKPTADLDDPNRSFTAGSWTPVSYGCTSNNIFCAGYDYSFEAFRDERIDPLSIDKMEFAYFLNTDLSKTDLLNSEPVQNVWTVTDDNPYPTLAFGDATPIYMIRTANTIIGFAQEGKEYTYNSDGKPMIVNGEFAGINPTFTVSGNMLVTPYNLEMADGKYVVRNSNDLDAVSAMVNTGNGAEFHITVIGEIETSPKFKTMGSPGNIFRGSITGGHIRLTNNQNLLFSAENATFTDLTVSGDMTDCESMFATVSLENCQLTNCKISGQIHSPGRGFVGGFAYFAHNTTFTGCTSNVNVVCNYSTAQGSSPNAAGFAIGCGISLRDCAFTGTVFGKTDEGELYPGLPFTITRGGNEPCSIENSISTFDPGVDELLLTNTDNLFILGQTDEQHVNFSTKTATQFASGEIGYILAHGGESHWHTPDGAKYPEYDGANTYRHAYVKASDGLVIATGTKSHLTDLYTIEGTEYTVTHFNGYDCIIGLNGETVSDNGSYTGQATMGESLLTVELKPTDIPEIGIDFINERLIGFTEADHTINDEKIVHDGTVTIRDEWFGSQVAIVATSTGHSPSESQYLAIPQRQDAPDITVIHATADNMNDGRIEGVDSSMSYWKFDKDTQTYTEGSEILGTSIDNLAPGKYLVRRNATPEAFASTPTEIEVRIAPKVGDVMSYGGIQYVILTLPDGTTPGTVTTKPGEGEGNWGSTGLSGDLVIPPHVTFDTDLYDVTEIGAYSLQGNVTSVQLPATLKAIGEKGLIGLGGITTITIPASVTTLGFELFKNYSGLKHVEFEEGSQITTIPQSAFEGAGLISITLPESVTTLENFAFFRCLNLTTIVLPPNLTSVGFMSFGGEEDATTTIIYLTDEPHPGSEYDYNFSNFATATLYALASSKEKYEASDPWRKFANIVWCGVELSKTATELHIDETETLRAEVTLPPTMTESPIVWSTSDPTVATVDDNGTITAIGAGQTTISATCGRFNATCEVAVNNISTGIDSILANLTSPVDIYNIQGYCIKRNATSDDIKALKPGFYIIGGHKVCIQPR